MPSLSGLFIYPIKSLGGISLQESQVQNRGLEFDRRWLVVDDNGDFLTQREWPVMATIRCEIGDGGLVLSRRDGKLAPLIVPLEAQGARTEVRVWKDRVEAIEVGKETAQWLSEVIGHACRLVWMPEESRRLVDPTYAHGGEITSFSDGFPFLILGQASFDDLNLRLEEPVPADRFRANFLFEGGDAFDEDSWARFRIGEVEFEVVKPCARCVMTTTDQQTGQRLGKEPLKTLAQYRTQDGKVNFAQNVLPRTLGTVRVGDEIEVLTRREPTLS